MPDLGELVVRERPEPARRMLWQTRQIVSAILDTGDYAEEDNQGRVRLTVAADD